MEFGDQEAGQVEEAEMVPGLFQPCLLNRLYLERTTVKGTRILGRGDQCFRPGLGQI